MEEDDNCGPSAVETRSHLSKKRKIRKGTQSCWQCKRRKVLCSFAAGESMCDGCRSRRTKCISQEFDDEATPPPRNLDERVCRMEALVEELTRSDELDPSNEQISVRLSERRPDPPGIGTAALSRLPAPVPALHLEIQGTRRVDGVSSALSSVWPVQRDLDAILSVPVSKSVLHHGVVCVPDSVFLAGPFPSSRDILRLPPPESHP